MRDGVVALDGVAAVTVHDERDFGADGRDGLGGRDGLIQKVQPRVAGLLRARDAPHVGAVGEFAGIADLPAHLGVGCARIEHHGGAVLERDDFEHLCGRGERVVADKFRRLLGLDFAQLDHGFLLRRAGACLLLRHEIVKASRAFDIHREPALARHELREIERKALLVIKPERKCPRYHTRRGWHV